MHSSDETGDDRKGLASTGGATEAETAKLPAHAFRERIRRASVAAAQATTPPGAVAPATTSGQHTPPLLLAPEQSGVHDRSSDAPPEAASTKSPQSGSADATATPPAKSGEPAAVSLQKQSSPSWPFAAGRDERRATHQTQLGIGVSPRSAAGAHSPHAAKPGKMESSAPSEDSDARRRMDTRDTKRSGAPLAARPADSSARPPRSMSKPAPPPTLPTKSTPPRPFSAREAKWSPKSTKPQRASLLRPDAPTDSQKNEQRSFTKTLREGPRAKAGAVQPNELQDAQARNPTELDRNALSALADEYLEVSVDAHGLSISASDSSDEQHAQDAEIVESTSTGTAEAASGEEADHARPRRYTPKQRGRSRERNGDSEERAEYVATMPDMRPSLTPINKTVRGQGQHLPSSLAGAGGPLRINQLNPIDQGALTRPGGQPVTPDTPTQPRGRPVPRLPLVASPQLFTTKPAFAHPAAFNAARQPHVPGARPAPRSPFAPAATHRGPSANYVPQHEASIVVDPSLNAQVTEARAPLRTDVRPVHQPYQPLPSDPAAFEQMMRDQAAARGVRLNWKQQATLVIPREELDAVPEQRLFTPKMLLGFVGATVVGALVMLAISQYGNSDATRHGRAATDTSTSAAANGNSVVIATEPSGAELLLDGAVVGNTPLELPRPPRGQAELTYVVRMRGFTQELIRLGAESQPAIRVTLTPEPGVQ